MKKFLMAFLLLCQSTAFADWLPASQLIPSVAANGICCRTSPLSKRAKKQLAAAFLSEGFLAISCERKTAIGWSPP